MKTSSGLFSFLHLSAAVLTLTIAGSGTARAQDLYVTYSATTTANIARITPAGAASVFITSSGNLVGLASDAANNLYVDSNNGGAPSSFVTRINTSAVGTVIAFQVPNPTGLAFDQSGLLYAADAVGNTITRIDQSRPNFSSASTFIAAGNGLSGPQGLAFDAAGNLYAANAIGNNISKITPGGVVTPYANVTNPFGLAFDTGGNLYVASKSGNAINRIAPNGSVSTFFSGAQLSNPEGIAFDASGSLYVANNGSGTILKIAPDGGSAAVFASGLRSARYLTFGPTLLPVTGAVAPEPGSLALLGLGVLQLAGIVAARRR